ncbi:hypothetical protein HELRODRAFT_163048 [Helobdella robusta]|uniref:Tetraspanin n=1 Tax=Helobdella robusta TaxID=6412 RepID=T1ETL6_HELRO|nr:hypothetical protein HELRODRAFT_163048 [Helobdella robusta]ESN96022.1 hypothetical protein HELRODRAFT_163048 [Helobdella robusta]
MNLKSKIHCKCAKTVHYRNLLKCSLILFSTIILVAGSGIFGAGMYARSLLVRNRMYFLGQLLNIPSFLGLFCVLIALLCIYGIFKDNKFILIILATVIFVSFLFMSMISGFLMSVKNYNLPNFLKELSSYQVECCGMSGAADWVMNSDLQSVNHLPESCCKFNSELDGKCDIVLIRNDDDIDQYDGDDETNKTLSSASKCRKKGSMFSKMFVTALTVTFLLTAVQLFMFVATVFHINNLFEREKKINVRKAENKNSTRHIRGSDQKYDKVDSHGNKYLKINPMVFAQLVYKLCGRTAELSVDH